MSRPSEEYVDVNGHATWLHRSGVGDETILLLHGGMSCSEDILGALEGPLALSHEVVAFDRKGHGFTADTDEPFHYESMADEVIGVVEMLGGHVHLVGWSDGGIAALLASRRRPDLVLRQVLIGTNFHHDGIVLTHVDDGAEPGGDPGALSAQMAEAYGRRSPDGRDHFPVVFAKFVAMARTEPTLTREELSAIRTPTLVLTGDDDMVSLEHTVALYEALPAAQLAVIPGTSHAVPLEKPTLVGQLVLDFIRGPVPPRTALPIRRAAAPA
jgi:pimeloyl-ACP methyl ester carboxylesterase